MSPDLLVGLIALTLLLFLEGARPFYQGPERRGRARAAHGLRNGTLMLVNGAVGALLAPLVVFTVSVGGQHGVGLGPWLAAHWADAGLAGTLAVWLVMILGFDLWMYAWHRANHLVPLLWRFHQVHHTDTAMDSTTALRFHPGELLLSTLANLPVLLLLGLSLAQLVLYQSLMLAVILFHHSNVRLPAVWERRLRMVTVPPSLHRVHHSRRRAETDANYGTLFSFWDRLFGSLCLRPDLAAIEFGTGRRDGPDWQSPARLLILPFAPRAPREET